MPQFNLKLAGGYAALLIAVMVLAALLPAETPGRSSSMTLPETYRETFAHYLTVERIDGTTRHLYINQHALNTMQAGQPLPEGTQLIIEAYDTTGTPTDDTLFPFIHMSEKRDNWPREEIAASVTLNNWNFETFEADTRRPSDENRSNCFTCHDTSAFDTDFVFSRPFIERYRQTGETQRIYCNRADRLPCF
jgi:hypothetical protein